MYFFKMLEKSNTSTIDGLLRGTIRVAKYEKRNAGDILIKYGDKGKEFFILVEGGCDVYIPDPYKDEGKGNKDAPKE